MARSYYVTTPIYYVNADPHIGHAYTSIAADVLARWHRLMGDDVRFQSGTDEHGLKIEQAARKAGVTPQAQADRFSQPFRDMAEPLLLSVDDFIRTTEPRHQRVVLDLWRRMAAKGDLYPSSYTGWYSVGDEAFFTEEELVDGKAPSGHPVVWTEEPTWFFRLSKYGPALLAHLQAHPEFVRPESRYNEVLRFVESGLKDLSISRTTFTWGIPVPASEGDATEGASAAGEGEAGHVIYVWLDALANYISALGGPEGADFARYWPADLHLIGKDILRFHAVFWPCFLMSAELPLPRQIFAHGWWTVEGTKMSKSLGNTIDPFDICARYGAEAFRFFLLREVSFGSDGDFSEQGLRNRINGDLANDFGNLVNRTLGMVARYRAGVIPAPGTFEPVDQALATLAGEVRAEVFTALDELAFGRALGAIWRLSSAANKYVDETAPWTLARTGADARLDTVLHTLCEVLRLLGVYTTPFFPVKGPELLRRLAVPAELQDLASTMDFGRLPAGGLTEAGDPLFPRLEDAFTERRRAKAEARNERAAGDGGEAAPSQTTPQKKQKSSKMTDTPAAPADPATPTGPTVKAIDALDEGLAPIDFTTFAKLDLRVAKVITAMKHPDADRLIVMTVDAGEPEARTICSGIAEHYTPESLVGRTVVLLANLKPRKIRGTVSHGMLLAAGDSTVKLLTLDGELPPGTKIS